MTLGTSEPTSPRLFSGDSDPPHPSAYSWGVCGVLVLSGGGGIAASEPAAAAIAIALTSG